MKLIKITKDELINHPDAKAYNPSEWKRIIERLCSRQKEIQFYVEPKETSPWNYNRYWAVYTIPEGIKLLNEVSYSSCLHNGGFAAVKITDEGDVIKTDIQFKDGTTGRLANCKENRKWMANRSQAFGMIFSND